MACMHPDKNGSEVLLPGGSLTLGPVLFVPEGIADDGASPCISL